jgi:beta-lactamase regulating signal transducer with metallopeptidase domain
MRSIEQAVSAALVDFLWQGCGVAVLLWAALFLLRRRAAQARYLAACAALAILAALPFLTAYLVYRPETAVEPVRIMRAWTAGPTGIGAATSPFGLANFQAWVLPIWSLGVLAFSLRLVWGSRQLFAWRQQSAPGDGAVVAMVESLGRRLGLERPARVLMTTSADCPSVTGWIRPAILLPWAALQGLTVEQLEAVLAHEIAHIRRYDHLVNLVQVVVETLLFYHPAVWWVSARMREERELCCDDLAVATCGDPICYARALTRLERMRGVPRALALGSAGGSLMDRVERILGTRAADCRPSRLPGILLLSAGLICFGVNLKMARGQEAQQPAGHSEKQTVEPESKRQTDLDEVRRLEAAVEALQRQVAELQLASEAKVRAKQSAEQALESEMLATQKRLLDLQQAAGQKVQDKTEAEALQSEMLATRERLLELQRGAGQQVRDNFEAEQKLKAEMLAMQKGLELGQTDEAQRVRSFDQELQKELLNFQATGGLAGRRLQRIVVVGLSEPLRQQLVSRLPLHLGDTLSADSLAAIGHAVKAFDSRLSFVLILHDDGPVDLRIAAPGFEQH